MTATKQQPAITERPILFSGEMVRAILDRRKVMTRRIFKGFTPPDCEGVHSCVVEDGVAKFYLNGQIATMEGEWTKCPYVVGQHLWVRETFCTDGEYVGYRADQAADDAAALWRPSIFMPRWASRLTLEVTGVRVERLQGITEADAIAEGVRVDGSNHGIWSDFSAIHDTVKEACPVGADDDPRPRMAKVASD